MAQYQREMIYRKYLSLMPKIECKVIYDKKLVAIHNSNPSKFHILLKKKIGLCFFVFVVILLRLCFQIMQTIGLLSVSK